MKTRLLKETRQLLPAWIAALLLASVPVFIGPKDNHGFWASASFVLGLVTLAVSSFGREFSQRTFSTLLAQPLERKQLWREKIIVLISLATLAALTFALFWTTSEMPAREKGFPLAGFCLFATIATVAGGLFMTIALRQILAAVCLTIIVPFGLMMLASAAAGKWMPRAEAVFNETVLLVYSAIAFWSARKMFLHAQDVQWTGGTVQLPSIVTRLFGRRISRTNKSHPIAALLRKEIQLHQWISIFAGCLLVLQIVALLLPKVIEVPRNSTLGLILSASWMFWLLMPLLAGAAAVSEERKLGTLESQLTLPVSRGVQFTIKLLVAQGVGVLLGALVPLFIAFVSLHAGLLGRDAMDSSGTWVLIAISAGLVFVSLYASTLTKQLLQALVAAIVILVVGGASFRITNYLPSIYANPLWRGPLVFLVLGPTAVAFAILLAKPRRLIGFVVTVVFPLGVIVYCTWCIVKWALLHPTLPSEPSIFLRLCIAAAASGLVSLFLTLSFWNFHRVHTEWKLWFRNATAWMGTIITTIFVTTAIYHRPWELAQRLEPSPGPRRLSGDVEPKVVRITFGDITIVLLPDGRLWTRRGMKLERARDGFRVTEGQPHSQFVGGSNWIAVADNEMEMIGVQSDGSLWTIRWWEFTDTNGISRPAGTEDYARQWREPWKIRLVDPRAERIGTDSDWKSVAAGRGHFLALKKDGTLWGWGKNKKGQVMSGPEQFTNGPVKIGDETNWTVVAAINEASVAAKSDGSVWKWGGLRVRGEQPANSYIVSTPQKLTTMSSPVQKIEPNNFFDVIICDDGTGWAIGKVWQNLFDSKSASFADTKPLRLWENNEWISVELPDFGVSVVAIKNDGTLWNQRTLQRTVRLSDLTQVGQRSDWIAAYPRRGAIFALAADGTLCKFGQMWQDEHALLIPSRRATWIANVLNTSQ